MSKCFSNTFILNGSVYPALEFVLPDESGGCIYEVLRIIDSVPLFVERHSERFCNSLKIKNLYTNELVTYFLNDISLLIQSNTNTYGNICYALFFGNGEIERVAYYIPHTYPTAEMYSQGVKLKSLQIERPSPNVKIVHSNIKEKVSNVLKDNSLYEVVLVDQGGLITEGSRSNLFFVKENRIFTAPDSSVLQGITRNMVIEIIRKQNLQFEFRQAALTDLQNYEAAFLTGTSPKVLAINSIDGVSYNVIHPLIKVISNAYDIEIERYINLHGSSLTSV